MEECQLPDETLIKPDPWTDRYAQFVAQHEPETKPDVLLINIPDYRSSWPEWPKERVEVGMSDRARPNIGLAQLAAIVENHTGLKAGVVNNDVGIGIDNRLIPFPPSEMAALIVASGASYVGLSLVSSLNLPYAREVVEGVRKLAPERQIDFMVGGPQASLDGERTAAVLGIDRTHVLGGRGEQQILRHLGLAEDKIPPLEELQDFDPVFLKPVGINQPPKIAMMNLISTGGTACLGKEPCAFCTAYFMGERREIPLEAVKRRIDLLKEYGVVGIEANDNFINLARAEERDRFREILAYAKERGIIIMSFLTRPELLVKTPDDILKEFKDSGGLSIFVGVESGDPRTLKMMNRTGGRPEDYLKFCREAAEKLGRHSFKSYFSFVFGFPDLDNPRWNGVAADMRSLELAAELMKLAGGAETDEGEVWQTGKSYAYLNFYLPFPGSSTYRQLVDAGVSPDDINRHLIDTQEAGEKFLAGLGGDELDLQTVLLRGGKSVDRIAKFSQQRRKKLASLVRKAGRRGSK